MTDTLVSKFAGFVVSKIRPTDNPYRTLKESNKDKLLKSIA